MSLTFQFTESLLITAIENSYDPIGLVAEDGTLLYLSSAAERTMGYPCEEMVGKNAFSFVHPDDLPKLHVELAQALTQGRGEVSPYRCRTAQGEWIWVESVGTRLTEEPYAGTLVINYHNVTERIKATEALEASESRFRSLVQSSSDMIGLLDENGIYTYLSPSILSVLGYAPEELIGQCTFDYFHPHDTARARAALTATLKVGQARLEAFRFRHANGEWRWIETIVTNLLSDPSVGAVVANSRDVTERKLVETKLQQALDKLEQRVAERTAELERAVQELNAAKEEAEAANLAKSEFLSRMSHELRTPLNAILGFGQVLEVQQLTPAQQRSVDYILKGGEHLLSLINEVLEISRVEAGHLSLSLEPVPLWDVVQEALDLVRPIADKAQIHILETDELPRRHVLADRQRLKQVLLNLLSNAVKYNSEDGRISISCRQGEEGQLLLAVQDTGPGLTRDDLQRLFVPFERLNAENSDVEGTGLGLALSKSLTEAMGGQLRVQSLPGQGSIFYIELPGVESPLESLTQNYGDELGRRPKLDKNQPFSVLLIEDNISNLRLIETVLESRPFVQLLATMQGRVGMELALQHHPDLILLDLHLPDVPGEDVMKQLQATPASADIPVVVCSADATPMQIQRLLSSGAVEYLTKPINIKHFLKVLDQAIENKGEAEDTTGVSPLN
jgi:PAS domain S-box-containing protein